MARAAPTLLGIETSCDDCAAAVMVGGALRASIVAAQAEHLPFGGVVPELASRAHQRLIVPVVEEALRTAGVSKAELGAVAVTHGPGLAGSLLVGVSFAKALALGLGIPLVGVNHLDGHLYSAFLSEPAPPFPFLGMVVSGGHTLVVVVEEGFRHTVVGRSLDDAAGEAFDKVAKMLGLGYPGGPAIDRLAAAGDPAFHPFPRRRPTPADFSFSGIKTAVLYYLNAFAPEERARLLETRLADVCAAFQAAVVDMLLDGLGHALRETGLRHAALSGGVSGNAELRRRAAALAERRGVALYIAPPAYCTDNAAMIAAAARFKLAAGLTSPLTLTAEPNLSLTL